MLVVQDCVKIDSISWEDEDVFDWLAATQVCHHWRKVAMETPRVWSFIPLQRKHAHLTKVLLRRSRQASLTVVQTDFSRRTPPHYMCYKEIGRIHALAVCFGGVLGRTGGTLEAPCLEILKTTFCTDFPKAGLKRLKNAYFPRLRSLECIHPLPKQLEAIIRPTLTSLIVDNNDIPTFTVHTLLDMLSGAPGLLSLELYNCIKKSDAPSNEFCFARDSVTLSSLNFLRLFDSHAGVSLAHLLNHLSIPATSQLDSESSSRATPQQLPYIISALTSKHAFGGPPDTPTKSLEIAHRKELAAYTYSHVTLYSQEMSTSIAEASPNSCPRTTPDAPLPTLSVKLSNSVNDVVVALASHLDKLSEVQHIRCDFVDNLEEGWSVLAQLPRVQALDIEKCSYAAVKSLLSNLHNPSAFPGLRVLRLTSVKWNCRPLAMAGDDLRSGSLVALLLRAVENRRWHHQPLQTIIIRTARRLHGSPEDREYLARLAELVDEFECSGATIGELT